MLHASHSPENEGVRKIARLFVAQERLRQYKLWLRQTTGLLSMMKYNTKQSRRNVAAWQSFLVRVHQSAYWDRKELCYVTADKVLDKAE